MHRAFYRQRTLEKSPASAAAHRIYWRTDSFLCAAIARCSVSIAPTPDGYEQLGEVHTHDVWKPTVNITDIVDPALSNGSLYVRTPEELICYDAAAH